MVRESKIECLTQQGKGRKPLLSFTLNTHMSDPKTFEKNPFLDFREEFTFTGATKDSIMTNGFNLPGVTFGAETSKPDTLKRKQPDNVNFLYQNYFRFQIQGFDTFNYFCQTVTLPGFGSQSAIEQPTRFSSLKIPSTKVTFDNLEIGFLVDENMSNWREIQDWMKSIYLIKDHKGHEKTSIINIVTLNLFCWIAKVTLICISSLEIYFQSL